MSPNSPIPFPVPAEADVQWTELGKQRAQTVKLEGIVPRCPKNMMVYFFIQRDGLVTVKMVPHGDIAARMDAEKGAEALLKIPSTVEDIFFEITREPAATTGRIFRCGSVDVDVRALVGTNLLPLIAQPDGSQLTTMPDGTVVSIHGRKPIDGGLSEEAILTIRRPTGKQIDVFYKRFEDLYEVDGIWHEKKNM